MTQLYWSHSKPSWLKQHAMQALNVRLREKRRVIQARASLPNGVRYLLCRPKGGLNDCLCQIQRSIIHALRFDRHLVIDSRDSGLRDQFSNYFQTIHSFANIDTSLSDDLLKRLNELSCHPSEFSGRLSDYNLSFDESCMNFIDRDSGTKPCLPSGDTPEALVLHDQCGGGRGVQALAYFRLREAVANRICERIMDLPKDYIALHIRYADVPFAVEPFLESIRPGMAGSNVLVCTDSLPVQVLTRQILRDSSVYQIADIPECQGQKLHDNPSVTSPETNFGALADLIALANAREIIFPGSANVYPSGFSQLAIDLSNRDDLLRQLIGRSNWHLLRSGVPPVSRTVRQGSCHDQGTIQR